jgi:hypothetical protein
MFNKKYFQNKIAEEQAKIDKIKESVNQIKLIETKIEVFKELIDKLNDPDSLVLEELKDMPKIPVIRTSNRRIDFPSRKSSSSGYRGIYKRSDNGKYSVQLFNLIDNITKKKVSPYLGTFGSLEDAIKTHNNYIDEHKLDIPKHKFKK